MPTVLLSPSSKSDVVEAVSSVSSAFRAVTLYFCSALVCASYLYLWFIISSIILLYIVSGFPKDTTGCVSAFLITGSVRRKSMSADRLSSRYAA